MKLCPRVNRLLGLVDIQADVDEQAEHSSTSPALPKQMREEMKDGGMIDKPLGSGGVKSGPPPKSGPNPQGLKVPLK